MAQKKLVQLLARAFLCLFLGFAPHHFHHILCPPNTARSVERTFPVKLSFFPDCIRNLKELSITGTGTFNSFAVFTVHSPSPVCPTFELAFLRSSPYIRNPSSSHPTNREVTMLLLLYTLATSCKRNPKGAFFNIANPSANDCIMPYSMPLCTIFAKCPAPDFPIYPASVSDRSFNKGRTFVYALLSPPAIMANFPARMDTGPPETPTSRKETPFRASLAPRFRESL